MLGKYSTPELHTPIQKLFLGRKLSDVNKCPYTTRVTLIPRFLGLAFSHPHPPGIHIVAIRNSTLCDLFAEVLPLNKERYSNYSGDTYFFYIVRMKIEEKRYFIEYYTAHYIAKAFFSIISFYSLLLRISYMQMCFDEVLHSFPLLQSLPPHHSSCQFHVFFFFFFFSPLLRAIASGICMNGGSSLGSLVSQWPHH